MNFKLFRTLSTAKYGFALVFLLMFGISAASVIFVLCLMLLCSDLLIANSNSQNIDIKRASWFGVVIAVALLARQMSYLAASESMGHEFTVLMNGVLLLAVFSGAVMAIRHVSDVFRTKGCSPNKKDRIYLAIKRPRTMIDYLSCVIGGPVSSTSFCINNYWLRYVAEAKEVVECNIHMSHGYTFVDTGIDASEDQKEEFDLMLSKPWSIKNNCVTGWYNVTCGTFLEPKPWEWLPSMYVTRVLKEIDNE